MQILAQSRTIQQVPYSHVAYGAAASESRGGVLPGLGLFSAGVILATVVALAGARFRAKPWRLSAGRTGRRPFRVLAAVGAALGLFAILGAFLYFASDGGFLGVRIGRVVAAMLPFAAIGALLSLAEMIAACFGLVKSRKTGDANQAVWKRAMWGAIGVFVGSVFFLSLAVAISMHSDMFRHMYAFSPP